MIWKGLMTVTDLAKELFENNLFDWDIADNHYVACEKCLHIIE